MFFFFKGFLFLDKLTSERPKNIKDLDYYIDFEKSDDEIKSNSKYRKYYDELILSFKSTSSAFGPSPYNIFYSPRLFELIYDKLYLMPLWSGVMVQQTASVTGNEFLQRKTRLDNNAVENHLGHVKVHQCLKRKIYPSEHVINTYKSIKAKHAEHYSGNTSVIANNAAIKKSNLAMDKCETWSKGSKTKSMLCFKFSIKCRGQLQSGEQVRSRRSNNTKV